MCGIVGYRGPQNAIGPVLEGLTRLEYRGYDSAGVSYKRGSELELLKKEGKIDNLKLLVAEKKPHSNTAIGHTRWATHGAVNDVNAHPHINDSFAIVHNGIIENARELKEDLQKEGYTFLTQTDTEVFLALVTTFYKQIQSVPKAILKAFATVEGNSAFVVMSKENDNLYAIKRGAPLVCGDNKTLKEVFISSDPYALIGFTENIYFPGDSVLCEAISEGDKACLNFYETDGSPSERYKIQKKQMSLDIVSKGDFEHFMLKEVHEQPDLMRSLTAYYFHGEGKERLEKVKGLKPDFIHIIGCGTAWHAGLVMKNFFEKINKTRTVVELASEFRYREPAIGNNDLGIFISQSGETADTLACTGLCIEKKIPTVSIVNVEGSTLYRDCDYNLLIKAGTEIGVASTKAFTQQVLTGFLLSQAMNGTLDSGKFEKEINLLADRVEDILSREKEIKKIAQNVYHHRGFIFTGRGQYFPIALEGALKLKEIAYVHAEGYAAGELKHGPIALIDDQMVNLSIVAPELYEKTFSNTEEVKARRGIIIGIGPENDKKLLEISDFFFGLNFKGLENFSPILVNIFMQLFSYHVAKLKGTDIDKPRNLAKSVTVE